MAAAENTREAGESEELAVARVDCKASIGRYKIDESVRDSEIPGQALRLQDLLFAPDLE